MRIITAPEAVQVSVLMEDGRRVPIKQEFKQWLTDMIDGSGEKLTLRQVRQLNRIIGTIEVSNGTISLEEAEYEIVKGFLGGDGVPKWFGGPTRQLLKFIDAVLNAEEVKG